MTVRRKTRYYTDAPPGYQMGKGEKLDLAQEQREGMTVSQAQEVAIREAGYKGKLNVRRKNPMAVRRKKRTTTRRRKANAGRPKRRAARKKAGLPKKRASAKWLAFKRKHTRPGMGKAAYKAAVKKHWKH